MSQISKTELTDNLAFLSALQMLRQLIQQGSLTAGEGSRTRRELERRLRVAAYARVSSDSADQRNSYLAQVDYYTRHIGENPD